MEWGLTQRHIQRREIHGEETYMEKILTWRGTYMERRHIQKEDSYGKGTYMKIYIEKGDKVDMERKHIRRHTRQGDRYKDIYGDIHGKGIDTKTYTERGHKTYTDNGHINEKDIHGEGTYKKN